MSFNQPKLYDANGNLIPEKPFVDTPIKERFKWIDFVVRRHYPNCTCPMHDWKSDIEYSKCPIHSGNEESNDLQDN